MQFPVPQFTEVEDKIIGPLTLRQFGVIFGAGAVIFLAFSATKSIAVLVAFCVLVGLPALYVALAPFNGRPVYISLGNIAQFMTSAKIYVYHKEVNYLPHSTALKDAKVVNENAQAQTVVVDPKARLREINKTLILQEQAEKELLKNKF
jgi:hypothetical protein